MNGLADALRYEWVRVTSLRSTFGLIVAAAIANMLIPVTLAAFTKDDVKLSGAVMMTGGIGVIPEHMFALPFALLGILGAMSVGQEYQHGTMRPTLTAVPSRTVLVAAKALVVAAVAGLAAMFCLATTFIAVALVEQRAFGFGGEAHIVMSFIWVMMVWSVLGLGVGLLLKHMVGAITALIVWPLIGENTIGSLAYIPKLDFLQDFVPYLPCRAANTLMRPAEADTLNTGIVKLSAGESSAAFLVFATVLVGLAWARFLREDV